MTEARRDCGVWAALAIDSPLRVLDLWMGRRSMLTQGSFFGEALSAKKAGRLWVVSGERAGGPSAAIRTLSPHDHHSEQSFRPFV